jgi:hypothetical protein
MQTAVALVAFREGLRLLRECQLEVRRLIGGARLDTLDQLRSVQSGK